MDYENEFHTNPLKLLLDLSTGEEEIIAFTLGPENVYYIRDPERINDVLVNYHENFVKVLGFRRAQELLGKGLFSRRLPWPTSYRHYCPTIERHAAQIRDDWLDGRQVDVFKELKRINLAVLADTICSGTLPSLSSQTVEYLDTIIDSLNVFTLPFPELLECLPSNIEPDFRDARTYLDHEISRTLENEYSPTGLSLAQKRDRTVTALLAGYEQIASLISWALFLLSQHCDVETRLHQEVDTVLKGRLASAEDVPALQFTSMIVNETLRLYPPVWLLARRAIRNTKIGSVNISTNTIVLMSQYAIQRDGRYFYEPNQFIPDRWLVEETNRHPLFSYFPFGHGPRMCRGAQFVIMECVLLLATLLQEWRLLLVPHQVVTPDPKITLRPRNGIHMLLEKRIKH